jgi:hypothetical protein
MKRFDMERMFLKIARATLIAVIAISLLLTAIATVFGAIQLFPREQPNESEIIIELKDMTAPKSSATLGSESSTQAAPGSEKEPGANKQCNSVIPKINRIIRKIGWDKKQTQVFDANTMQYETKSSIDYDSSVDADKFCNATQSLIEEQNAKLSPHSKPQDIEDAYYREFNKFLRDMEVNAVWDNALPQEDTRKYYALTSILWFNNQFALAVDVARERALQKENEETARKVKGTDALYVAGTTFAFFFTCCMVLVFIRIEVNTKELVEVIRAFENRTRVESPK